MRSLLLSGQVMRHSTNLGRDLLAHLYLSAQEGTILFVPFMFQDAPSEKLERRPEGATFVPYLSEATDGARLPIDAPIAEIGRAALQALLATEVQEFDPQHAPLSGLDAYLHGYLYKCAPDEEQRHSYVDFYFGTREAHWLTLSKVYEDLDDSDLQLEAGIRMGSTDAVVGNWILRLFGAYQTLRQTHERWWRPILEEAGQGM